MRVLRIDFRIQGFILGLATVICNLLFSVKGIDSAFTGVVYNTLFLAQGNVCLFVLVVCNLNNTSRVGIIDPIAVIVCSRHFRLTISEFIFKLHYKTHKE